MTTPPAGQVDLWPTTEWDLVARREALNIPLLEAVELLDLNLPRYRQMEGGHRGAPAALVDEYAAMEDWVEDLATDLVETGLPLADAQIATALDRVRTDTAACTRTGRRFPEVLAYTAAGRAAVTAKAAGAPTGLDDSKSSTELDLLTTRLACGLSQRAAAIVLHLDPRRYTRLESGALSFPVAPGILAEMHAMATWVNDTIPKIIAEATIVEGAPTLWIYDDPDTFSGKYPEAISPSGRPYPIRLGHVAVARAAGRLALDTLPVERDASDPRRRPRRGTVRIDEIANRKS